MAKRAKKTVAVLNARGMLGRVYDPCFDSSGMFVQPVGFLRPHANGSGNGGREGDGKAKDQISIYGQESTYTTWRIAGMKFAIWGIEGQIAHDDTFHNDQYPDSKVNFILAKRPFNISDGAANGYTYAGAKFSS